MSATIRFTAGRLLCGKIRDFLQKCRFDGMQVEWYEGNGWIERDWIIKGNENDMCVIKRSLELWETTIN